MKTIVTLGYHYEELEWGRIVREEYYRRNHVNGRDITFYEVTQSDVEKSDLCQKSLDEISARIIEDGFGLWIDIHCGYYRRELGPAELSYKGYEEEILQFLKNSYSDIKVENVANIPEEHRTPWLKRYAVADSFFPKSDFQSKNNGFRTGLERTLDFIVQIYDAHLPVPYSV
jgi:hypothetical protein